MLISSRKLKYFIGSHMYCTQYNTDVKVMDQLDHVTKLHINAFIWLF